MARSFAPAFLADQEDAKPFLCAYHKHPPERLKALQTLSQHTPSAKLLDELTSQQQDLPASPAREAHLQALREAGTTVVITGQQVGLMLGPLYTLHKAATAIALARDLQAQSGQRVVPLFWLQVEDHDLEEIATCAIPTSTGLASLRLKESAITQASRNSVAHIQLEEEQLSTLFSQLNELLDGLPAAEDVQQMLRRHYQAGATLGEAFAGVLAEIFAEEGLLIFDPRRPALAPLAAGLHRRAIFEAEAIEQTLHAREEQLKKAGFRVQIPSREGSTLCFYHPEGREGPRYRIMRHQEGFCLAGRDQQLTPAQMEQALEEAPQCFSTSALLRPLLQDRWFPTAAYVGGPGEIAYFAQLAPLYQHFAREMPMILPRGRFLYLDPKQQKALDALGITLEDLQASEKTLLERLSQQGQDHPLDMDRLREKLWEPLQRELETLRAPVQALDPNLEKPLQKVARQIESNLEKLFLKIQRVRLSQNDQTRQRLESLQNKLFPNGTLQERVLGMPYFAAYAGTQHLKKELMRHYHVYQVALHTIELTAATQETESP